MTQTSEDILNKIAWYIADLNLNEAKKHVEEAISKGIPAEAIINKGIMKGSEIVGERYETKEYFLPELVMAGEIIKEIVEILKPRMLTEKTKLKGRIVIGTVRGDIHDIGKNIVASALIGAGFEVYDLGVDVPPEKFIAEVKRVKADFLAMSALLTTTMLEMKTVINELKKIGHKVKVIVGGRPVTKEYANEIGADAYGENAFDAVKKIESLLNR